MRKKRCHYVVLTPECHVLKELRESKGLSMRAAGTLLGKSDTYISHIENGRMDFPEGERLEALLNLYGPLKLKSFRERVRLYKQKTPKKEVLRNLVDRVDDSKIDILINLAQSLV
jgi:transcriptional regulator with XRE-family HTH domain